MSEHGGLPSGFSDSLETLYALTEDTAAQPLKTYYVQDGSAFTALVEGTDYRIGDPVPAASWYEKNLNGRQNGGSNNAPQSNLMQWLNSTGAAKPWFRPQTLWDTCGNSLLNRNGFCRFIDPEFLRVVQPAKLVTALCSAEGGGAVVHSAGFWPLSMTPVFGFPNNGITENVLLDYYAAAPKVKTLMDQTSGYGWKLRSPVVFSALDVRIVLHTGDANSYSVSSTSGISPACIIA